MPRKSPVASFISVVDLSSTINWTYVSESCTDLIGYESSELIGASVLDFLHPDDMDQGRRLHLKTIMGDKAANVAYTRMRHKNPAKGYILIAASHTAVEDVMVGSITLALPGPGTMHTIATAAEVNIVAPEAMEFVYHKWAPEDVINQPASLVVQPEVAIPRALGASSSAKISTLLNPEPDEVSEVSSPDSESYPFSLSKPIPPYPPLPRLSPRLALVLDRFSRTLSILYMSNTRLLPPTAYGKPFFDFVRPRDERLVRAWLEAVKGWDAGAGGLGAGGGFGYGRFGLVPGGRNSRRTESGSRHRRDADEKATSADIHVGNSGDVGRTQKTTAARTTREQRMASVGGQRRTDPDPDVKIVDGIFSAHSDGLLIILKHAKDAS